MSLSWPSIKNKGYSKTEGREFFEPPYLENVLPRAKLRYVHPLAIDVVPVYIATIHGNPLVAVIGAFVPEIMHPF